jgi:hypothetical protein
MATPNIQMSKPGGLYRTVQALTWQLSDQVERFSFTVNGVQPTLSKYIAYDTLSPPNPFIAVTQDGAGNVVYDGGFPKFYNMYAPAANATFAQLSASFKFLYNAINFCANKKKTEIGNKRILLLGDGGSSNNNGNYRVLYGGVADFHTSFTNIAKIAGYSITIKDRVNYAGGYIDARFAELDQYCMVIVMSSDYGHPVGGWMTDQCVTDMVTYRERGNGIIVITDHSGTNSQAADAAGNTRPGFHGTGQKLVRNFGSYFTGNYDRTPVNVGFLRATYGDHALYNGMTNAESIHAGYSESKVVVTQYPEYTAANAPVVNLTTDGKYVISILAILKDGTPETYRYVFNIVLGEFLWWKSTVDGHILGDTYSTKKSISDFLPYISPQDNGTLFGSILRNGKKIGSFVHDEATGSVYKYLSGSNIYPVNDKDTFTISVEEPFSYNKTLTVARYQPPVSAIIDHAHTLKLLGIDDYVGVPPRKLVNKIIKDIAVFYPEYPLLLNGDAARDVAIIRRFTSEFVGDVTTAYIYALSDDAKEGRRILTTQPNCIIDAEKNEVWEYQYPEWLLIDGLKAQDFLGAPRRVTSITNGDKFLLRVDGSIVQI